MEIIKKIKIRRKRQIKKYYISVGILV